MEDGECDFNDRPAVKRRMGAIIDANKEELAASRDRVIFQIPSRDEELVICKADHPSPAES